MSTATAKAPPFDAPASDWLVYADALQEARDPRGELITLVNAGNKWAEREAHVKKNAAQILGEAGKDLERYLITWRHCLIESVDVLIRSNDDGAALVANILSSPAAGEIRSIRLVGQTADRTPVTLVPAMEKLLASLPATCHAVSFIDERATKAKMLVSRDYEPDENLVVLGALEPFYAHKNIDSVEVEVADMNQLELGAIKAPQLKKFALRGLRYGEAYGDAAPISRALNEAEFSKLEDFELRLVEAFTANVPDENEPYVAVYTDDDDLSDRLDEAEDGETEGTAWNRELEPLFKKLKKCPLKRLALTSFDTWENVLTALEADGLPETLQVLDLSDSTFDESAVKWIAERKEFLAKLDTLILERTRLTADQAKELEKLGPKKIVHSESANPPTWRFVVGME